MQFFNYYKIILILVKVFESSFLTFCNNEENIGKKKKRLVEKWHKMSKDEQLQYSTQSDNFMNSIDVVMFKFFTLFESLY